MVKRYYWTYDNMEEDRNGSWVDYDDYVSLSNLYESQSRALEAQKNATNAYMRDYEREYAIVRELEDTIDEMHRQAAYNAERYG